MFKSETVQKAREKMHSVYAEINAAPESEKPQKAVISRGNRKIGRVLNVSIAPLLSCLAACPCMLYCYDIKAVIQYINVLFARVKNFWLAVNRPAVYFGTIENALAHRKTRKYFRWHVGGDIINAAYFAEMVEIAKRHTDFIFWTYTKKYGIVNAYCEKHGGRAAIPENPKIMFSEWDGMPVVNPFVFPLFSCKLKAGNKNHPDFYFYGLYKCPGNCDVCIENGRGCVAGESAYADEH